MAETKAELHKGKQQITISQNKMDQLQRLTYEEIKNIQLKNEQFEKDRRIKDEDQRIARSNKILFEAQESNKQNAALEMKWADLKELEECEELNKVVAFYYRKYKAKLSCSNKSGIGKMS
jgi:dynein regulatory complex protein 1